MNRSAILTLGCLLLLPASGPAQNQTSVDTSAAATPNAIAVAVLQQCSASMGAPSADTDIVAVGRSTSARSGEPVRDIVIKAKGLDRSRTEQQTDTGPMVHVWRGARARTTTGAKVTTAPPWATAYPRPEYLPALLCGTELARANMVVQYLGTEVLETGLVHHIKIFAAPTGKSASLDAYNALISEFHIFLDTQSLLPRKTSRYVFSPEGVQNRSLWETYYSGYRTIRGIAIPFTISQYIAGQKLRDITFSNVDVNVGLTDADFQ